ncbi:hypothetical protein T484DRAFT_2027429 [Baffinella frigidus]|nr:hypothetical protein T484DRAFT_2027429 [Cryptophyta sp. CCMP2293]
MSAGVEYEYTPPLTPPSEYATMPRTPETTPRNGRGEHSLAGFMMDGLDQRNQVTWLYSLCDPRAMRNDGALNEFLRGLHTSELKLVCGVVDLVVNRRTLYSTGRTRDQREDIQEVQWWDNMCAEWKEIFNDERRNDLETYTDIYLQQQDTHTDMVLGGVMSLLAVSAIVASSAALPITLMASVSLPANHMASASLPANHMASAAALPANHMASAAALPVAGVEEDTGLVDVPRPVAVVEEATGLVDVLLPVAVEEEATGLVDVPWDDELYLFSGLADVPWGSGKEVSATAEYASCRSFVCTRGGWYGQRCGCNETPCAPPRHRHIKDIVSCVADDSMGISDINEFAARVTDAAMTGMHHDTDIDELTDAVTDAVMLNMHQVSVGQCSMGNQVPFENAFVKPVNGGHIDDGDYSDDELRHRHEVAQLEEDRDREVAQLERDRDRARGDRELLRVQIRALHEQAETSARVERQHQHEIALLEQDVVDALTGTELLHVEIAGLDLIGIFQQRFRPTPSDSGHGPFYHTCVRNWFVTVTGPFTTHVSSRRSVIMKLFTTCQQSQDTLGTLSTHQDAAVRVISTINSTAASPFRSPSRIPPLNGKMSSSLAGSMLHLNQTRVADVVLFTARMDATVAGLRGCKTLGPGVSVEARDLAADAVLEDLEKQLDADPTYQAFFGEMLFLLRYDLSQTVVTTELAAALLTTREMWHAIKTEDRAKRPRVGRPKKSGGQ